MSSMVMSDQGRLAASNHADCSSADRVETLFASRKLMALSVVMRDRLNRGIRRESA